jgi:hypothetical protein
MYSPGSLHAAYLNGDEIVEELSSLVTGNQPDYERAISQVWAVNKTILHKTEAGIPVIDLTKVQGLIEKLEHVRTGQFAIKKDGSDDLRGNLSLALRTLIASVYSQRELAANLLSQKAASAQAVFTAPENSPQANSLFGKVVSVLQSVARGNQPKTPPTRDYHHDIPPELMRLVMEDDFQNERPANGDATVIGAFSPAARAPSVDSVVPEFTSPRGPPTNELVPVQVDSTFSAGVFPTHAAATTCASTAETSPRGPPDPSAAAPLSSTPPETQQRGSTSTGHGESATAGDVPVEQEQGDSSEMTSVPETTNEETSLTSANPGATSADKPSRDIVDHEPIRTVCPAKTTVEPPPITSSEVPSHKIDPPAASASSARISDNGDQDKVQTSELSELHAYKQLMTGHANSPFPSEQCEPTTPPCKPHSGTTCAAQTVGTEATAREGTELENAPCPGSVDAASERCKRRPLADADLRYAPSSEAGLTGLPSSAAEPVPAPTLTLSADATVVAQAANKGSAAPALADAATADGERVTSACDGGGCDKHCVDKTEKLPGALRIKTTRAQRRATRTTAAQTRRAGEYTFPVAAAVNGPPSLPTPSYEGTVHDVDKANSAATTPGNVSSSPIRTEGELQHDTPLQPDDVSATANCDTLQDLTAYPVDANAETVDASVSVSDVVDKGNTKVADVAHTVSTPLAGIPSAAEEMLGGAAQAVTRASPTNHRADGLADQDDKQRLTRLLRRDTLGQVMIFGEKREIVTPGETPPAPAGDNQPKRSPQLLSAGVIGQQQNAPGNTMDTTDSAPTKLPDYTVEDGSSDSDCAGGHHPQSNSSDRTSDQVPLPQPQPSPAAQQFPVKTASGVRPPRKPKPPRTGQHGDRDSGGGSTDREIEAHREDLERRRERAREKSWEVWCLCKFLTNLCSVRVLIPGMVYLVAQTVG